MQSVDLQNWSRKNHFRLFQQMDIPQITICANIDVTHFIDVVKTKKISFYFGMIYASMRVANDIVNFRYRIRDDQVVLHDSIHPSFTFLQEQEEDAFRLVVVEMEDNILHFAAACEEKSKEQGEFSLKEVAARDDLAYITCIPWVSFTQLTHTVSLNKNDSVPRIAWGKYFFDHSKVLLPFSVQVHHGLADGVHVGRYFTKLQEYIDTL